MTIVTNREYARDAIGHGCFAIDLEDHVQAFREDIRDALIARGVLALGRDGIWRLAWHGFDLHQERAEYLAVCDFCSARPVTWTLRCAPFELPPMTVAGRTSPPFHSPGDWAACDACGTFVQAGHRRQLLDRALAVRARGRSMRLAIEQLHRRFWQHFTGEVAREPARPFGH